MADDDGRANSPLDLDRPRPKPRHRWRKVLAALGGIALIGIAAAIVFVLGITNSVTSNVGTIPTAFPAESLRPTAAAPPSKSGGDVASNILVIGSDSRDPSATAQEKQLAGNHRSDTLMLLHIPADHKSLDVMSIMRDTWVTIPGYGEMKINAAYAYGGVPLVVQTIEGLFGVRIDHVAVMDFSGFSGLSTALGGVSVNVPLAFTSKNMPGFTFAAGKTVLRGDATLAFVRERYAFADGDFQRVRDQQAFFRGLLETLSSRGLVTDPVKLLATLDALKGFLSVDGSLDVPTMAALILSMKDVHNDQIFTFTLPSMGTGTSADGQSIVKLNQPAVTAIGAALADDTLGHYLEANGMQNGN